MLRYLKSDDPILITEAWQWASTDSQLLNQLVQDGLSPLTDILSNQLPQSEFNQLADGAYSADCSTSESDISRKVLLAEPSKFHSQHSEQLSLLVRIEIQKQRIGWRSDRFKQELENLFGKHSQPLLTHQLIEWLHWLENQKSPN